MYLRRVQIPNFRILKDIDLSFEHEFIPHIFPVASLNGGGKSTLLQLVFVLLHCSGKAERLHYLKNMLEGIKNFSFDNEFTLATFDILHKGKSVSVEFLIWDDTYIQKLLKNTDTEFKLSAIPAFARIKKHFDTVREQVNKLEDLYSDLQEVNVKQSKKGQMRIISNLKSVLSQLKNDLRITLPKDLTDKLWDNDEEIFIYKHDTFSEFSEQINKKLPSILKDIKERLQDLEKQTVTLSNIVTAINQYLNSQKLIYLTNFSIEDEDKAKKRDGCLLCRIDGMKSDDVKSFLNDIADNVFLAIPITQIAFFLPQEERHLLFEKPKSYMSYQTVLSEAQSALPGFFTWDFKMLASIFKVLIAAQTADFQEAVRTDGKYGNSYETLIKELNMFLDPKKIKIKADRSGNLSGIKVEIEKDGKFIQIPYEDLSHGELRKLTFYVWLKNINMKNSLVLVDEIEIAFNPDWQYNIVSNLQDWSPNNQYLLATHSFDLCQALPPAHVKALEPKLEKRAEVQP
ncbi:MAG: AAA family ATPase [Candidatus Eremiobacterota bacterium]